MKNISIPASLLIFISLNIFSQSSLLPDSVKPGLSYKFVLYDDSEIIGKVISCDSLTIDVRGEEELYRLRKEDIFFISRNLVQNKFNAILSLGGGTSMLSTGSGGYVNDAFKSIVSLQFAAMFPISENKGIRVDVGYSGFKKDKSTYEYSSNDISTYGEQTKDFAYAKGDFVFGMFAPENKFWVYGTAGVGMHFINEGSYTYTHSYHGYPDSTYYYNSNFNEGRSYASVIFSIGGSMGYRFSKQFGVYLDAQLNTVSHEGFFFFFWGAGYIPIRAGITYIIF